MTTVRLPEEMGALVREVVASYETRVCSVAQIVEATHAMLETFRRQHDAVRTRLRETLARAASLRKRDFDLMMQALLDDQEARERAIKRTMRDYLAEQQALAAALREALAGPDRIDAVKTVLGTMVARGTERERQVRDLLAEYRRGHEELARGLGGLLSNGGSVGVKELKATLRVLRSRCWGGERPAFAQVAGRGRGDE